MSYYDIYKKRLNRYGNDVQGRIQGQRERVFDEYVKTSLNRVSFNDTVGVLERNKQDYVETTAYLLTFLSTELAPGTILDILSLNGMHTYWMVWWKEKIESSGYNKYTVLQMTNEITWYHDGVAYTQRFFVKGPGRSMINDTIKSSSTGAVYSENDNKYALVSTILKELSKEDYVEFLTYPLALLQKADEVSQENVDDIINYFDLIDNELEVRILLANGYDKDKIIETGVEQSIRNAKNMGISTAFVIAEVDSTTTPGIGYYTLDATFKRSEKEEINRDSTSVDSVYKGWLEYKED